MIPIIAIVGKSKTGKTTLIERLIKELKSKGYRVATAKHTSHEIILDKPGKDSWRHIQAGSEATVISSLHQLVFIKPVAKTPSLDEIARLFGNDYDIIIVEGFKQSDVPKIEVHRKEAGQPYGNIKKLIAIATDESIETNNKQFSLQDIKGLANFIEANFLKPSTKQLKTSEVRNSTD